MATSMPKICRGRLPATNGNDKKTDLTVHLRLNPFKANGGGIRAVY